MSVATRDADRPVSEPREREMTQLKRKSLGRSASPDENGHRDAPAKRLRVEDVAGASPEAEEQIDAHGSIAKKNGATYDQDTVLERESCSLGERFPEKSATVSRSPQQQRRPSESSKRDRSPHQGSRSPDQFRRPSDSRRRGSSPPAARDRRGSEASRRGSVSQQRGFGEKDRNRRRPEASRDEEKKRGKRLFGGLLSTLSQTTTNSQQKRRLEIEKKQQEKAAKQKIEDDQRRTERLTKLARIRKVEQIRFDEQVMRTRHSNMLAMARSLHTTSEPRLYYRPWELTPAQEDIIKDQIRDAEALVEDELQRFRRRKEQQLKDLGGLSSSSEIDATVGDPMEEDRSNRAEQDESAASATNHRKHSLAPAPRESHEERDHDEMVEAEEDTVIY